MILEFSYRGVNNYPAAWYGRLFTGSPADDATLASLSGEPSGNGYAALSWTRNGTDWGAITTVAGMRQTRAVKKTYGPATTADWPEVNLFVLTSVGSGTAGLLWARFAFSPQTLRVGETLDVQPIGVERGVSF